MGKKSGRYDHVFKILLIGDSGVGKSSIIMSYTDNTFSEEVPSTIGVDFKVTYLNDIDGKTVKLTIWDTAGQERFRTLTSSYYRSAQGVILVYDVSSRQSFENIKNWLKEVNLYSTIADCKKILVGNKIDLEQERKVSTQMGQQFASDNQMLFIEVSAKTRQFIDQAFQELTLQILGDEILLQDTAPVTVDAPLDVDDLEQEEEEESSGCCGF